MPAFDTASYDSSLSSSLTTIFRGKLCDTVLRGRRPIGYDKGATIYDASNKVRTFFFIRRGVVKVGTVTAEGQEIIYDLRKDGDVVGELCACEASRRDRAVALEPSEVIAVPYDEILDSLQKNRTVLQEILEVICRSLSSAYEQAELLSSGDMLHRLIKVLLRLANQLGRPEGDLVEIDAYLTQEEISQMLAASRERVSGALNLLRNREMVQYTRGGHLLLDVKALENYRT
jgi:CRP/FNR family transcriptional regulator, cyclic AMP receptor protein